MTARLTPYLGVADAASALAFYERAFGARERYRLAGPDGSVMHAETQLDGETLMLADVPNAPPAGASRPVKLVLDVADCDSATERAVAAGGVLVRAPEDQFHGHRQAVVRCPFGYEWFLSADKESLSDAEIQERFAALFDASATERS